MWHWPRLCLRPRLLLRPMRLSVARSFMHQSLVVAGHPEKLITYLSVRKIRLNPKLGAINPLSRASSWICTRSRGKTTVGNLDQLVWWNWLQLRPIKNCWNWTRKVTSSATSLTENSGTGGYKAGISSEKSSSARITLKQNCHISTIVR